VILTICDQGDPSVGIGRAEMTIDWPVDLDSADEREEARAMALRWYAEAYDGIGRVRATWEGECECCGNYAGHSTYCPEVAP
jgi:hypothetical protein